MDIRPMGDPFQLTYINDPNYYQEMSRIHAAYIDTGVTTNEASDLLSRVNMMGNRLDILEDQYDKIIKAIRLSHEQGVCLSESLLKFGIDICEL